MYGLMREFTVNPYVLTGKKLPDPSSMYFLCVFIFKTSVLRIFMLFSGLLIWSFWSVSQHICRVRDDGSGSRRRPSCCWGNPHDFDRRQPEATWTSFLFNYFGTTLLGSSVSPLSIQQQVLPLFR